jgi:hypothetical protein
MKTYEPFSRLLKKADNSMLKSHVVAYIPAGKMLKAPRINDTSTIKAMVYEIGDSDYKTEARVSEVECEFPWDGTPCIVSSEIIIPTPLISGGKNVIHSDDAQTY